MQNFITLCDQVADLIAKSRKIVLFTGAGISTESGIPDFRSPGGIWERFDPDDFTYEKFISDAAARRKHWQVLREGWLTTQAVPNPAHHAIAQLHQLGRLDCVITQNVDNLHQRAGVPADRVLELHGNLMSSVCLGCGQEFPFEGIRPRLDAEDIPDCQECHGILKPNAVFFGESLPADVLTEATRRSRTCDLFIVVGSTLVVYPAAHMPQYAVSRGAPLVIINLSETPMDDQAQVVVRARAGETMTRILQTVSARMRR